MPTMTHAARAYQTGATHRSQRDQEADVFRYTNGSLRSAVDASPIKKARALADNRRLWLAVGDLMQSPENRMPLELRASIASVGLAVQREMDREQPNFAFLIQINQTFAEGLTDSP
jgi:flagellar protein FlaF